MPLTGHAKDFEKVFHPRGALRGGPGAGGKEGLREASKRKKERLLMMEIYPSVSIFQTSGAKNDFDVTFRAPDRNEACRRHARAY